MKKYRLAGGVLNFTEENKGYNLTPEDYALFMKNNYATTYGEITLEGLLNISKYKPKSNSIFYDLGSGTGRAVLHAVNDCGFTNGVGIELSPTRHRIAMNLLEQYSQYKNKITFIQGDLFEHNISPADFVFVSNLCFPVNLNQKLATKLGDELKTNTIVVTSSDISDPRLKLLDQIPVKMTWGISDVRIYKVEK